jgi:hypothetical protein
VRKVVGAFLVGLWALLPCGPIVRADGGEPASTASSEPSAGATFFEEDDPTVRWSGSWPRNLLPTNSGGTARLAMEAGAEVTFAFTGAGVSWIGYRDEWCGMAEVSLDGVLQATVDTYSTPARAQATLYTVAGLGGGAHTLTLRTTGTQNAAAKGSWIWVDGFSVVASHGLPSPEARAARESETAEAVSPGPENATRLEQDDPTVTWKGAWSTNQLPAHSSGSARLSMDPSARVSLVFRGTGVTWVGYRDEWSGIADVRLDGRRRATVDSYSTPATAGAALYTIDGLTDGTHTLVIRPTSRHHPASGGSWIWVDAFAITR